MGLHHTQLKKAEDPWVWGETASEAVQGYPPKAGAAWQVPRGGFVPFSGRGRGSASDIKSGDHTGKSVSKLTLSFSVAASGYPQLRSELKASLGYIRDAVLVPSTHRNSQFEGQTPTVDRSECRVGSHPSSCTF